MTLEEINIRYAVDITKFFCEEYSKMLTNPHEMQIMIDRQLCKRLYDTGVVSGYRVVIEDPNKQLLREGKLNAILGEGKTFVGVIDVNLRMQKGGQFITHRHNIVI